MPELNIYGAVIASIGAYVTASILNLMTLRIWLKITMNFYEILIKPCFAATIMMIFVLLSYNSIYINIGSNGLSCLISIFLGMIVYIILVIVFKIFEVNEIKKRLNRKI